MPMPNAPASTSLVSPGGRSSIGPTSRSPKVEALPLVRQRRAAGLVQRNLEHAEPEDRALEADRRELDADLLEQLLLRQRGDLGDGLALDDLGQHRRGGLRDRAAAALEADVVDRLAVVAELERDRHLVAAERVLALGLRVGLLDHAVAARGLVVVEDDLAIHVLEFTHACTSITRRMLAASRSTSSLVL